jgi:hypothetical protein
MVVLMCVAILEKLTRDNLDSVTQLSNDYYAGMLTNEEGTKKLNECILQQATICAFVEHCTMLFSERESSDDSATDDDGSA